MTKLITLKAHRFAGRLMLPGVRYEAGGQIERTMRALKWVDDAPSELAQAPKIAAASAARTEPKTEKPAAPPVQPAAAVAPATVAPAATPPAAVDTKPPAKPKDDQKRTYARRDLTAEP